MTQKNQRPLPYPPAPQHGSTTWASMAALVFTPLYHRRKKILVWFGVSLLFAIALLVADLALSAQKTPWHEERNQSLMALVLLVYGTATFLAWQKIFLAHRSLFLAWSVNIRPASLLLSQTLSSWLLAMILLALPWLVIVWQGADNVSQKWGHIPVSGLVLLLSCSSISFWFWVWNVLLPSQLAYAALACLGVFLFVFSGALFPVDGPIIWLKLMVQGGAILSIQSNLQAAMAAAIAHFVLSASVLWFFLRRDPIGLYNKSDRDNIL